MSQRQSGVRVPDFEAPNRLGNAINGGLGSGNVQRGAFGAGDPRQASKANQDRAQWVPVKLAGASGSEIEIIHSLGTVPTLVELAEWEGGTGTALSINSSNKDRWTATTARVTVYAASGTLDNTLARFRVWGA